MNKVATVLLCLSFITVLFPQPGYIHPDEFFQSCEIVAGDILHIHHHRAWEFNSTLPIRSIVFPYMLTAPSLTLLHWINSTSFHGFRISTVKVVMATRLPVAFLNIFGYLATGKIADHFGAEKYLSTVLWCSSYVLWSYYTRTFSNSIESFLLSILLLICIDLKLEVQRNSDEKRRKDKCLKSENGHRKEDEGDAKSENVKDLDVSKEENPSSQDSDKSSSRGSGKLSLKDNKESSSKDNNKLSSKSVQALSNTALPSDIKLRFFFLGILVTAGFFNRPTFLSFSAIPILYWCVIVSHHRNSLTEKLSLLVSMSFHTFLGIIVVFTAFVSIDSFYYNDKFLNEIQRAFNILIQNPFSLDNVRIVFEILLSSLVITPWNFLKYNFDFSNLAQHGIHPHYTHLLVNIPLLLGPLCLPFLAVCLSSLYLLLKRGMKENNVKNIWLVSMALFPVLVLSIFPHQEPRFLIPLLPLFIVTGAKIVSAMAHGQQVFLIMWVIFNVVLHLIYGYLHQAAVIPALSIYQQKLSTAASRLPKQTQHLDHLIFYKTYPPPRHLLLLDDHRSDVKIHDLAGAPIKVLMKTVLGIEREMYRPGVNARIFIFIPATVSPRFMDLLAESESDVSSSSICPHLSTESLPRFKQFWSKRITFSKFLMDFCLNIIQISARL